MSAMVEVTPLVLGLDDARAIDPAISGAKGAGLARARAAGFPVLDGFVISAAASAEVLAEAATELESRGSGGARLRIIRSDLAPVVVAAVEAAAAVLDEPLIVRSSSVLEGDGAWSGAFTSVPEVRAGEVAQATRSVWATCFALEVLERFESAGIEPGAAPMGVVVQPEIAPDFGGVALVDTKGAVTVTAVKGSPRDLLAGWAPGSRAVADGVGIVGTEAIELMGESDLRSVVDLAKAVDKTLDHNLIEWAIADGRVILLQIQRSTPDPIEDSIVIPAALAHPFTRELVQMVQRAPGPLGEDLVLGWLPALSADLTAKPAAAGSADDAERTAADLAARLLAEAWDLPPVEAAARARLVLRRLRSDHPDESIEALQQLGPVDPEAAAELLGLYDLLQRRATAGERLGIGRWEPMMAGVIALQGVVHAGTSGVSGVGAGRMVWVDSSKSTEHVRPRDIIVAQYPLANLSPLLWDAAGIVTLGGAPSAHLFEVARSLTVPAVVGCPIGDIIRAGPRLGMLDGGAGRVAILDDGPTS